MIPPFTSLNTPVLLHALTANNPVSLVLIGMSLVATFVVLGIAIKTTWFDRHYPGVTTDSGEDVVIRFPKNSAGMSKEAR